MWPPTSLRGLALVGAFFSALTCVGCGSGPKVVPVTGKVLLNGQPAVGAFVQFHLDGGDPKSPRPSARVKADGSFELSTTEPGKLYTRAGAPPGSYRVTVMLRSPSHLGDSDEYDLLPLRYLDPRSSGLSALVNEADTQLPTFDLTNP